MADTVPLIYPVTQVMLFVILPVQALFIAAAHYVEQVRVYEIYQSNNNVDVIVNLSLKLHERK